ncbi:hypothetical protein A0H81_13279 [Grifola frondosa]|uniref:Uncharacterized protein n=1 Tax=Grifola frondosa TaxID=5627 RepID=A0A1C7LRZ9_GRIFR|nr:hypothetical protein A0H81_13279 [Grifola frondosa]
MATPSSKLDNTAMDDLIALFSQAGLVQNYRYLKSRADKGNKRAPAEFIKLARAFISSDTSEFPQAILNALWKDGMSAKHELDARPDTELCELMAKKDMLEFLLAACIPYEPNALISKSEHLDATFNETYVGDAVMNFVNALTQYDRMYKPLNHYGRIIPFIQSSGAGKSRLVKELARHYPTLSVCFRSSQEPMSGWPQNDIAAHEFFIDPGMPVYVSSSCLSDPLIGEEMAAAFLGAWARVAFEDIAAPEQSSKPIVDRLDGWRVTAENPEARAARFSRVAELARQSLQENEKIILTDRRPDRGQPRESMTEIQKGYIKALHRWHEHLFRLLVQPHFEDLGKALAMHNVHEFFLAFDECAQLNVRPNSSGLQGPKERMSVIALARIVKVSDTMKFSGVTFWSLLLDTDFSVFHLIPSSVNPSHSRFGEGYSNLPLWPFFGFDQKAPRCVGELPQTPADAHLLRNLQNYGRPYWSTLLDDDLLQSAKSKLIGPVKWSDPTNIDLVFAIFSNRILLEIGNGTTAMRLAAEAVRSHMRLLMGVRTGNVVSTKAASEPMLAIAAADILNAENVDVSEPDFYTKAMTTLVEKLVEQGLVLDRGLQGELSARLLLTVARDRAALPKGGDFVTREPPYRISPVSVSAFLKRLLAEEGSNNLRGLKQPSSIEDLLESNEDMWINFTHFVQFEKEIDAIDVDDLYFAWCRTAAIQCSVAQPVIDIIIVTYGGDLDEPVDKGKFGYIVVQVSVKSKPVSSDSALVGPFIKNRETCYKPWCHIALILDLCTTSVFENSNNSRVRLTCERAVQGDDTWKGYNSDATKEAYRYCLNVRGHDAGVYPLIKPFESQFARLFQRVLPCEHAAFQTYSDALDLATRPLPYRKSY